jgi:hypothetical protein
MNKLIEKIKSMPLASKIIGMLWLLTFILLIVFVIITSVYNSESAQQKNGE